MNKPQWLRSVSKPKLQMCTQSLAVVKAAACGYGRSRSSLRKPALRSQSGTCRCGTTVLGYTMPGPAVQLKWSQYPLRESLQGSHEMQLLEVCGYSVSTASGSKVGRIGIKVATNKSHMFMNLQTVSNTCKYLSWAILFCIVGNIEEITVFFIKESLWILRDWQISQLLIFWRMRWWLESVRAIILEIMDAANVDMVMFLDMGNLLYRPLSLVPFPVSRWH